MPNKKGEDHNTRYSCFICHYYTSDKTKMKRHNSTNRHNYLTNPNKKGRKGEDEEIKKFNCECGKQYKHQSSFCNHKKKCINNENKIINTKIINNIEETNYKELLLISLKQNKEMQDFIIKQSEQYQQTIENQQNTINEIIPKINNTNNTNNINNVINSNINNNFNLNFFLNEKCKDAITMDEFLNKIQVSLSNLLYTKEKGIAEGLSNIFIENMNKIPLTQRPIHCTDVKRETIYIKNEQWEKDENKSQTKDVIKKLSNIQIKNICKFKEAYPELMKNEKQKDDYMEIIKTTTDDIQNKEEKVIKSICKTTYIKDKSIE